MRTLMLVFGAVIVCFLSAGNLLAAAPKKKVDVDKALENAGCQYLYMKERLKATDAFPKTYDVQQQKTENCSSGWWCSGFYPGTLFYLYEETGNKDLYTEGERMLKLLEREQYNVSTHDIGFMMYCSYGNANRIVPQSGYKDIMVNSARSLISRFSPVVGCIKSHNRKPNDYVVIIDNMMNLELLFWAAEATGDSTFYDIAVKHADTTLKNHFRADNSLYHGINYDPKTGGIQSYQGGQGVSEQSAWARGQAWGLYGYTLMYRFTKDSKYLDQAVRIAEFVLNHPNMPKDLIPYWDYNAPDIPNELRDASAAAINCAGLLELCQYMPKLQGDGYFRAAEKMLQVLSSSEYTAEVGTNGGFILKHSVGNMPAGTEVDAPLTYADYYYVEALCRYKSLTK